MSKDKEFSIKYRGFLDGLANKEPDREYIRLKQYRDAFFKGFWKYHERKNEITGGNNN